MSKLKLLRADLHVHTAYSPDSTSSLPAIIARCLEIGINCLAVTDHNSIAGALELKRTAPFYVIVGEEILTTSGEVIGLFLSEYVPHQLSIEETVTRIKAQRGLVCIPHPYDRFRRSALRRGALERIVPDIDLIEVFNSRTLLLRDSDRAKRFASSYGLPATVGSDAHTLDEIGNAYIELPEFDDASQFIQALRQGQVFGRRTGHITRPLNFMKIISHKLWTQMIKRLSKGH
ncbi:PHP-associated domain-containing protein [Chloroflexota bacterium]